MLRRILFGALFAIALSVAAAQAGNPPFGGDDTGFIPPAKSDVAKCEVAVSKAVAKMAACVYKCHDLRATGKLASDAEENACEFNGAKPKGCTDTYVKSIGKIIQKGGCPSCILSYAQFFPGVVEQTLDSQNGDFYCASPSGAFIDGQLAY